MKNSVYYELAKVIEKNPFGIPKVEGEISKAFIDFLKLIYTEEEARIVRYLEPYPFFKTAQQVADESGRNIEEVKAILDGAAFLDRIIVGQNVTNQLISIVDADTDTALPVVFFQIEGSTLQGVYEIGLDITAGIWYTASANDNVTIIYRPK